MSDLATPRYSWVKSLFFVLITLGMILAVIEVSWRFLCLATGVLPPTSDPDLKREWDFVAEYRDVESTHFYEETPTCYDPDLGWSLRPGFQSDRIHINSDGIRGTTEYTTTKREGVLRIAFIGDSYTFGHQVSDEENFASLMRRLYLPGVETLNFGVPGYGMDQVLLRYERDVLRYQPDIVVLGVYTRDVFRNLNRFRGAYKPRFEMGENGELVLSRYEILSATETLRLYKEGIRKIEGHGIFLLEYLERSLQKLRDRRIDADHPAWKISEKILEKFTEKTRESGIRPFLLIVPHKEILRKKECRSSDVARLLARKAEDLGIPYLNLVPVLRKKAEEDSRPLYDGHLTAWGHRVVAEALYRSMRDRGLFEDLPGEAVLASP